MTNSAVHECNPAQLDKKALLQSLDVLTVLSCRDQTGDLRTLVEILSEKLARNRFNLAVVGQMKRGKSSFINASHTVLALAPMMNE